MTFQMFTFYLYDFNVEVPASLRCPLNSYLYPHPYCFGAKNRPRGLLQYGLTKKRNHTKRW